MKLKQTNRWKLCVHSMSPVSRNVERDTTTMAEGTRSEKQPRPSIWKTYMQENTFVVLLAYRLLNAFVIKTFFQPDEYYQSLEPAWWLAFGDNSGAWLTWVCLLRRQRDNLSLTKTRNGGTIFDRPFIPHSSQSHTRQQTCLLAVCNSPPRFVPIFFLLHQRLYKHALLLSEITIRISSRSMYTGKSHKQHG